MLTGKRIAFIGGGSMAEALIGGLLRTGRARTDQMLATDILPSRSELLTHRFGIETGGDNAEAISRSHIVVLAVEPRNG